MLTPQLMLLLYVAAVLFSILDQANSFTSFVPHRIHLSRSSPSPRTSRLSSSSPSRRPSPPNVSRLWSSPLPPFNSTSGPRDDSVDPDLGSLPTSSHNATTTTPSRNSIGLPKDFSPLKLEKQLAELKGEIDAVTAKIDAEKAEWKKANAEDKPVYQKSIDVLNSRLEGLISHRRELSLASIAAQVPPPGKGTPLCECCALCGRQPPLCVCD